jgi:septal ring factor EnvC (AmiA/AmiB activator)
VTGATAQDELSSEQLRRMYDDAVVQLKTAQDRRNELARENQKLRDRIAELEKLAKQADKAQAALNVLADKTFEARAERAAFQEFLAANPSIRIQWQLFREKSLLAAPASGDPLCTDWPLPDKPRN